MAVSYKNINSSYENDLGKSLIHTAIFILPLAVVYEIGILMGGLGDSLNGADATFRLLWYFISSILGPTLSSIFFALICLSLIVFVIYQIVIEKLKINFKKISTMYLESIGFGFLIAIILSIGLNRQLPSFFTFEINGSVAQQAIATGLYTTWSKIIASIGAGIFEELLFRVILLNIIFLFLSKVKNLKNDLPNFLKSAIISSILFTLMHLGTVVSLSGLSFIFITSIILSFIYMSRGYAVVAGAHIIFDLLLLFGIVS